MAKTSVENKDRQIYIKFQNLELKFWFRLLKVLYIIFLILTFLGCVVWWWETKPYKVVDNENSYIQCERDKEKKLVYYLDKNDWNEYGKVYGENPTLSYYHDEAIRKVCAQPLNPETGEFATYWSSYKVLPLNYEFSPILKTEGSYSKWLRNGILGFILFVFLTNLIKEIFYYVATGKRVYRDVDYLIKDDLATQDEG
jgi:hypothetical protein